MEISVIVATFNRCNILPKMLDSLINQTLAPELYEIIVVDNGSVDDTRILVESWINRNGHHNIRYVLEARRGSSLARNRGAREASGSIVAFIDDDVTVVPEWLECYVTEFARYPEAGVVGGPITLVYEGTRPDWLTPELDYTFAKLDYGTSRRVLSNCVVYEGNMAIARELFMAEGGFSPDLGRHGNNYIGHEGEALQRHLWKSGFKTTYLPQARVYHHIYPQRLSRREICRRWYGAGRTPVLRQAVSEERNWSRLGYVRSALYHLRNWVLDSSWWRLILTRRWFEASYRACGRLGEIRQEIEMGLRVD